jgi:L-lysine exporter family protein LysE/ArgO
MSDFNFPVIEGFVVSAGLIAGFGPQNTLVLRHGLRRQHLLLMVALCTLLDACLIGLGTIGVGALLQGELLTRLLTCAGVVALLVYGAGSFRAGFMPASELNVATDNPTRRQVIAALLAVSLLNPSVYIDTVLLIGGSSNHYHADQRGWFAAGAMVASLVWFSGLSYGSALLAPMLGQPRVLRGIHLLSGGLLWFMAFRLASHVG